MKLRTKLAVILSSVFVLYLVMSAGMVYFFMEPTFEVLEQEQARWDVERCLSVLGKEVDFITAYAKDLARLDATYQFMQDRNEAFVRSNLAPEMFEDNELDFIFLLDLGQHIVWSYLRPAPDWDPAALPHEQVRAAEEFVQSLAQVASEDPMAVRKGYARSKRGPVAIAACPVIRSNRTGPARGTLVMGALLNAAALESLRQQVRLDFTLHPAASFQWPRPELKLPNRSGEAEHQMRLREGPDPAVKLMFAESGRNEQEMDFYEDDSPRILHVVAPVKDIQGQPTLILSARIPRVLRFMGVRSTQLFMALFLAVGAICSLALLIFIHGQITRPLSQLCEHVMAIGRSRDLGARLNLKRSGEVGAVAGEFDRMLARLEEDDRLRRQAEQELRSSEERYRRILATTAEGFCLLDAQLAVADVNQALCDQLGSGRDELMGRRAWELIPTQEEGEEPVRSLEQLPDHIHAERTLTSKDGRRLVFLVSASTLHDPQGQAVGRIVFLTDITEMKKVQELRDDIERITRHDLKSPLFGIINFPKLIKQMGGLSEQQTEFLGRIEFSGYRMLRMINSSLDLYKMEQGTYQLQPQTVDLVAVFGLIGEELASLIRSKRSQLIVCVQGQEVSEPGQHFLIQGDDMLCYSMLENLVKNALEASPGGQPVRVNLTREDERVGVEVWNQGVVPEEIRPTFFEKYATSGKAKGTGLGTYSARLIARTHGGEITFTSNREAGTLVRVDLPAV